MAIEELQDLDDAREFLLEGLWLQQTVVPTAPTVRPALEWCLEIAANGQPLPPVGIVADLGRVALNLDRDSKVQREELVIPHWTKELAPRYVDYVLGKVYDDWTFERAGDALRSYGGPTKEKDRRRGLAYIIKQFRERAHFTGVELPPGAIRNLLDENPNEVIVQGFELIKEQGPSEFIREIYRECIEGVRRMAEVLALEDVIALEQRTALADMGQYVAHRQVLQMANRLESVIPHQKIRPIQGRREVPTRVLDEDTYPVGGFSSISNRGTIESLLHSQLAYMEPAHAYEGPDLFDVKFVRDELYYYSRDENQFLRRRRCFIFALAPELTQARFKDEELPCQRIVLLLAMMLTLVRKLTDWLSTDAIKFEFLIVGERPPAPLDHEEELLRMLMGEQIENGTVEVARLSNWQQLQAHCEAQARKSMCHCLGVGVKPTPLEVEHAVVTQLVLDGPRPALSTESGTRLHRLATVATLEAEDAMDAWGVTLLYLLGLWV